jgi:hypothetical protein
MNQRKREAALPEQGINARLLLHRSFSATMLPETSRLIGRHGVSVEQSEAAELLVTYR